MNVFTAGKGSEVYAVLMRATILCLAAAAAGALHTASHSPRASRIVASEVDDSVIFAPLETSLAGAAGAGYTLRPLQFPASAPEAKTLPTMRHGMAPKGEVTLYRDGNAWCPFCERVWLQLLEKGEAYNTVLIDIGEKKPPWYTDAVPTGQTPSAVINGEVVWESVDIMLAIEEHAGASAASLLPAEPSARERVVAELRAFDSPTEGPGVGGAGYMYMRGAPFGETPGELTAEKLDALRDAFEAKLGTLEARLAASEGPWFEDEYGVLDIALWPVLERMQAGLAAFRGYSIRDAPSFPAVGAWLRAMAARPAVAQVASDDGTLIRLFSRVFGMGGARSFGTDAGAPAAGSEAAREAAAKLVANRQAVRDDILQHAQLEDGTAALTPSDTSEVVDLALALVAARLADEAPPDVAALLADAEERAAAGVVACAALAFLRARVSAPRDMTAAAAAALRAACAAESSEAFDRFGYV